MVQALQFLGLISLLESPEFRLLEIQPETKGQPVIFIEPLHGEEKSKLFRLYQKSGKMSEVLDASGAVDALREAFDHGYQQAICQTDESRTIYHRTPKGIRISSEPLVAGESNRDRLDVKYLLESPRVREVLLAVGILTKEGSVRREQYNKLIQVKNFLAPVREVLPELRDHQPLHILDAACGKSYLSFVLYHFMREEWGLDARFHGIDTNGTLIERCRQIQATLSYSEMEFSVCAIQDFRSEQPIHMLYSLHGCDTATDEAIAAGVRLHARVIMVVPCCHFELRGQLRRHPLKSMTRFGLFEERFAALLTDALRAQALEAAGYEVSTFRFVTDDISPKNTLIRAVQRPTPRPQALQQYRELRDLFEVSPAIERLMPAELLKA